MPDPNTDDKQPVAGTDPTSQPKPGQEGGAQGDDDVDAALRAAFKEVDEAGAKPAEPAKATTPPKATTEADRIAALERTISNQAVRTKMDGAIARIKAAQPGLASVSSEIMEATLEVLGRKHPEAYKAFALADTNPGPWNAFVDKAAERMAKELGAGVDTKLTRDRAAAQAAVRGRTPVGPSDKEPTSQELHEMSNVDFNAYKRQLIERNKSLRAGR